MMKSQYRIPSLVLLVSYVVATGAFQQTVNFFTSNIHHRRQQNYDLQHQHYAQSSSSSLNTASKETTDMSNDILDDDDNDSWVLRQITFQGLTAPPTNNDDVEEDTDKNALDARNLSEFLMEIGAVSVSITDSDKDTENEHPLFDEPSLSSVCTNYDDDDDEQWAMIIPDYAAGRNLWKTCNVSAHFPNSIDIPSIIDAIRYTFHCPTTPRYTVDNVPDLDWIIHVQESWEPIVTKTSKFVLRFPWHTDTKVMKVCQSMEMLKMQELMNKQFNTGVKRDGAVVHFDGEFYDSDKESAVEEEENENKKKKNREYVQIELEGGIAFGTGEHPTTQLCLDWVRDKVEQHLSTTNNDTELNFLDYGAGSGILGIAASSIVRDYNNKQRGSMQQQSITTVGIEIDADAIHIANDNAIKNKVRMLNYLPDSNSLNDEALSVVMRAQQRKRNIGIIQSLPDELNRPMYDLCVANILALPLINLSPTIAQLVVPGGEIGLSGVLSNQASDVVEAYSEFFDDVVVAGEEGGWVLITGKRR